MAQQQAQQQMMSVGYGMQHQPHHSASAGGMYMMGGMPPPMGMQGPPMGMQGMPPPQHQFQQPFAPPPGNYMMGMEQQMQHPPQFIPGQGPPPMFRPPPSFQPTSFPPPQEMISSTQESSASMDEGVQTMMP